MPRKITKTKKITKRHGVRRVTKEGVLLKADTLGIAKEHVITPFSISKAVAQAFAPSFPISVPAQTPLIQCSNFRRPLVGPQTSFWLGVGFGIFIIGVLGYLAVRLFQVELAEAVVVGLTQSR